MIMQIDFTIDSSNLQQSVVDSIARNIYYELINSGKALEVAEEIKAEADNPEKVVLEDILWDIAYFNAEKINFNISQIVNIELKRN